MVRKKTINDIREALGKHKRFNISDFKFEIKNEQFIIIHYEYDSAYYFQVSIPSEISLVEKTVQESHTNGTIVKDESYEDYNFSGRIAPGKYSSSERFELFGEKAFFKQITIWLDCLWQELISIPINRQMEEHEKVVNEIKDKLKSVPDTYFSNEEGEEMKRKIDSLEKLFQQKLEKEFADKGDLQKKLNELHQELETLKATIFSVKKRGWYKSFAVKTFTWITKEENRKFLKDAGELIKPLLPPSINSFLPPDDK